VPVARAADLEVIRTAREHLRPPEEPSVGRRGRAEQTSMPP
jgi:hypothetical protein